jgi:hypothetical protein
MHLVRSHLREGSELIYFVRKAPEAVLSLFKFPSVVHTFHETANLTIMAMGSLIFHVKKTKLKSVNYVNFLSTKK